MVLCLIHLMKKGTIYQLKPKELRIDGEMLGQIVRYGLPSGVQNSVIGFANVIVQSNINSFGKVAMAAYGAYSKLEGFAFLPVTSFTMADHRHELFHGLLLRNNHANVSLRMKCGRGLISKDRGRMSQTCDYHTPNPRRNQHDSNANNEKFLELL